MTFLILAVLFALGVILASFMGVLVGRIYTGEGFLTGRSRCDACGATLPVYALVPVLSYVALGGHAHCCGARLSPVEPLAELALGVLFALSYDLLGATLALISMLAALALLYALVRYDLAHQILPPPLLAAFVAAALLTGFLRAPDALLGTLVIAAGIALFLALIYVGSRGRAMGLADAPLAFGLACLAGPLALSGFVYSFWTGALLGIILLARRPRGTRMGVEVPFAPFLAAGFLLAIFTQWNLFAFAAVVAH